MGNLTIERIKVVKVVIHSLAKYVVGKDILPMLSDAPCAPPDDFRHIFPWKTGCFLHMEGSRCLWSDDIKGLFGPLLSYYWDKPFEEKDVIADVPVWGILQDSRWVSGYLAFRGSARDDDWECHHTELVITKEIPEYDLELLAQSIQWTIQYHQKKGYFQDSKIDQMMHSLSKIAPLP
ncbi:MAG: hypothetical protein WC536_04615 [Patescibacteria group bacterium]